MSAQFFIAAFGLTAVYMAMVSQSERARKLAPLVGLLGQPFWLWATWHAGQAGMFSLCCAYTLLYAKGAWQNVRAPASGKEG